MSTVNNGPQIVRSGLVLDLDASYMRSYSPNVMPNPTDIFAWCGSAGANAATLSRDTSMTRQYGSIPMKMAVTGNDPYTNTINYGPGALSTWNLAPAANGQTWTISVYVKASVATTGELFLMPADSNGVAIAFASGAVTITTSWSRVSFTYTISSATTAFIQARLDGTPTSGSGITIWWDGLQVERASAATNFNPYYFGNTSWRDTSGNGYNGTLTSGPTFDVSNKGSILFDGVDDYGSTGNVDLSNTNVVSVDMWVKVVNYREVLSSANVLLEFSTNFNSITTGFVVTLGDDSAVVFGNTYPISINVKGDVGYNISYWSKTLVNNLGWHHWCCILDKSQATPETFLYIDGISRAGNATSFNSNNTNNFGNLPFYFGGRAATFNSNIQLSNVKIYNRALNNAEILQNYEATKTRFGL